MPKILEHKLAMKARQMGLKGEKFDKYVFGTMKKTGWKPNMKRKTLKSKSY